MRVVPRERQLVRPMGQRGPRDGTAGPLGEEGRLSRVSSGIFSSPQASILSLFCFSKAPSGRAPFWLLKRGLLNSRQGSRSLEWSVTSRLSSRTPIQCGTPSPTALFNPHPPSPSDQVSPCPSLLGRWDPRISPASEGRPGCMRNADHIGARPRLLDSCTSTP